MDELVMVMSEFAADKAGVVVGGEALGQDLLTAVERKIRPPTYRGRQRLSLEQAGILKQVSRIVLLLTSPISVQWNPQVP
jgi:hypothetical protein